MTTKLTRKETARRTRERLLETEATLFAAQGYAATSLEAIAAGAGHTKGAVYANFTCKEALFLEVFKAVGRRDVDRLIAAIEAAPDRPAIEALLIDWADERARSGSWPLTLLEFARQKKDDAEVLGPLREILDRHWRLLGEAVAKRLALDTPPLVLGCSLHEIAYAPAMSVAETPSGRDLMALFLKGLNPTR